MEIAIFRDIFVKKAIIVIFLFVNINQTFLINKVVTLIFILFHEMRLRHGIA